MPQGLAQGVRSDQTVGDVGQGENNVKTSPPEILGVARGVDTVVDTRYN